MGKSREIERREREGDIDGESIEIERGDRGVERER